MKKNLLYILPIVSLIALSGCDNKKSSSEEKTIPNPTEVEVKEEWEAFDYSLIQTPFQEASANATKVSRVEYVDNYLSESSYNGPTLGNSEINTYQQKSTMINTFERYKDLISIKEYESEETLLDSKSIYSYSQTDESVFFKTDVDVTTPDTEAYAYNLYRDGIICISNYYGALPSDAFDLTFQNIAIGVLNDSSLMGTFSIVKSFFDSFSFDYGEIMINKATGDIKMIGFLSDNDYFNYEYKGNLQEYNTTQTTNLVIDLKNDSELGYIYKGFEFESNVMSDSYDVYGFTYQLDEPINICSQKIEVQFEYTTEFENAKELPVFDKRYSDVTISNPLTFQEYDTNTLSLQSISPNNTLNKTFNERLIDPEFNDYLYTYRFSSLHPFYYYYTFESDDGKSLADFVAAGIVTISKRAASFLELIEQDGKKYFVITDYNIGNVYIDVIYNAQREVLSVTFDIEYNY